MCHFDGGYESCVRSANKEDIIDRDNVSVLRSLVAASGLSNIRVTEGL